MSAVVCSVVSGASQSAVLESARAYVPTAASSNGIQPCSEWSVAPL